MSTALQPGLTVDFRFRVPPDKTVPHLYPEIEEGRIMPEVFATGFMVGLIEFACIKAVNPHIDWPREQTVGIRIDVSHLAPTPPGMTVRVEGRLEKVAGRRLVFSVAAYDDADKIAEGSHERFIVDAEKFKAAAAAKLSQAGT